MSQFGKPAQKFNIRQGLDQQGWFSGGATSQAMSSIDNGVALRTIAQVSSPVYSVIVNYGTVTAPQPVTLTYETIDANGKPSGAGSYDANAVATFTPAAGFNVVTFPTPPTTNRTPGQVYCVVLIATATGTTMSLRAIWSNALVSPCGFMSAIDGTTRANFGTPTPGLPIVSVLCADGNEYEDGGFAVQQTTTNSLYGTNSAGTWFTVPTGYKWLTSGAQELYDALIGAPTGDLRCRLFDSANNLLATGTVPKGAYISAKGQVYQFGSQVTLNAGTYRLLLDQTDHTSTISNRYLNYCIASAPSGRRTGSLLVNPNMGLTTTTNIDATPPTFIDSTDGAMSSLGLLIDDIVSTAGGSLPPMIGSPLIRRAR